MPKVLDIGRVVVKTLGREAGRKAVIVDIIDGNFVLITGPKSVTGVKRRRVNVGHIEPTEHRLDVSRGASDEEVEEAIRRAGLEDYMREKVRPRLLLVTREHLSP